MPEAAGGFWWYAVGKRSGVVILNPPDFAASRPDADIQADIEQMIARYPPLAHDRHSIRIRVNEGKVMLSGYVRTLATRRYFLTSLASVRTCLLYTSPSPRDS